MGIDLRRTRRLGGDDLYIEQDGVIFCWSDSNYQYEPAWWLTSQGDPVNDGDHVRAVLRDRPFKKEWLK